jgi:hypothetical protein
MYQYTIIHAAGKESEYSVMQKRIPCAPAPKKDSPFIPVPQEQGSSGSECDKDEH